MAAVSTIIAGAALGLGAATSAISISQAKKQRKQTAAANKRQETQAKEAAAKDQTRSKVGADLIFGTSKASDALLKRGQRRPTKSGTKTVSPIGGL